MITDRFYKQVRTFILALSLCVLSSAVLYAHILKRCAVSYVGTFFYFLVSAETHVSVAATDAYLDGGAGYVMEIDGKEYAVYACYFTQTDGETAQGNLRERGKDTRLLCVSYENLFFKTQKEKSKASETLVGLNTLKTCLHALGRAATALENGTRTQESVRAELAVHTSVLGGLARGDVFPPALMRSAVDTLESVNADIVFAKDVRYVQLMLCDAYRGTAEKLSL